MASFSNMASGKSPLQEDSNQRKITSTEITPLNVRRRCLQPEVDRNTRRRLNFDPATVERCKFQVYLPNRTSFQIQLDIEVCQDLTVQRFVALVREEHAKCGCNDAKVKEKQRQIQWGSHIDIEDFEGNILEDGGLASTGENPRVLLLQDHHPDSVHSHSDFWNVTPEPHLLGILPQEYTLFSALADELDNSLQAVSQLQKGYQRLICVYLDQLHGKITIFDTGKGMDSTARNSITKWGTIGSSTNRHSLSEGIGGEPPYLKPNFGLYGFGGIGAGLHLGGSITVSSKTEEARRVAVLDIGRESLQTSVKAGNVWKTAGEFRMPTEEELRLSPHFSFTKVEISDLNPLVTTWKVEEVRRKLKDYYFPYIQNDECTSGRTSRPVEIRVNEEDLAGVVGGEVAHTHYYSGTGQPYVLILELSKPKGTTHTSDHDRRRPDKANARITCHYYPIKKGKEAIDDILDKLKEEDPDVDEENFDTFSRRTVRRLGRLLPDAKGGRLPFMEPKRGTKLKTINMRCFKRVKASIDVDAGFVPTTSKMDLVLKHPFTEALLNLGLFGAPENSKSMTKKQGVVTMSITREGKALRPEKLHTDYVTWITEQHEAHDEGATFNEDTSTIYFSKPHNKEELGIKSDVFRVLYGIKCRNIEWNVGSNEPPVRLKLMKGLPGLYNNDIQLYVTVECFISEGLAESPGTTKIICRPMGVPPEKGSKETEDGQDEEPSFVLRDSRVFPEEILYTDKFEVVDEAGWVKHEEKVRNKLPSFVELLNGQEVQKFGVQGSLHSNATIKAGTMLPSELIAVVRPSICKKNTCSSSRTMPKYIVADHAMEMRLEVRRIDYHKPNIALCKKDTMEAPIVYETLVKACTRSNVKGLYFFNTGGTALESITKINGTYILLFTLASPKFQHVGGITRVNVTASTNIEHWSVCSHPGDCGAHHQSRPIPRMNVRLGGVLPESLYLTKVDEFKNPIVFSKVPKDVECKIHTLEGAPVQWSTTIDKELLSLSDTDKLSIEIPRIGVSGGNLEPLKPTNHAELKIIISKTIVTGFPIIVLPGGVATACMKESEALIDCLHPGQTIQHIVFQALDNYKNPVGPGERIKILLEGIQFQDKIGIIRPVDGNGCIDLGMRLRVTAGYGQQASIELRSVEDLHLWETTIEVLKRSLRIANELDHASVGSQLDGVIVEAVDEYGHVDETMDGLSHNLTLSWNPDISIPLRQGRCTLPAIQLPGVSGLWMGRVAHTQNPELLCEISVWIKAPPRTSNYVENDDPHALSESNESPCAMPAGPSTLNLPSSVPVINYNTKALVPYKQRELVLSEDHEYVRLVQVALQATMAQTKGLQDILKKLGRKVAKYDKELIDLRRQKSQFENLTKDCQGELEKLGGVVKIEAPYEIEEASQWDFNRDLVDVMCTPSDVEKQIAKLGNPPGTHAATMMLEALKEQGNFSDFTNEDIIGIVAMLGSVQTEPLNRALVEFLGVDNMVAIVCGSRSAVECIGLHDVHGKVDISKGLHGFARGCNILISGRFRVICLTDEARFYKRLDGQAAVDNTHPQRLLNMNPSGVDEPISDRLNGFLGYAVNLIELNSDQLKVRVSRHGLRESLFFHLFSFLQVFDTTNNMLKARKSIRAGAVSLDGGIIRERNQFELGTREDPIVQFPMLMTQPESVLGHKNLASTSGTPRQSRSALCQQTNVLQKMDTAHKVYAADEVELQIFRISEDRTQALQKIKKLNQDIQEAAEKIRCMRGSVHLPIIS